MRFIERRSRGYATALELTAQDIAGNPNFAAASPGDLAVEQNGAGPAIVMTRDAFDAHYELDDRADAVVVAEELGELTVRLQELEARVASIDAEATKLGARVGSLESSPNQPAPPAS